MIAINEALAARLADVAGIDNPVGLTVGLYCPCTAKSARRQSKWRSWE